jgi:hypothetical protein
MNNYSQLDIILADANQCTNKTILPPEPPGVWFSFAKQPPTVGGNVSSIPTTPLGQWSPNLLCLVC